MTDEDSPKRLTDGAWLPGPTGALVWVPGVDPAPWQDTRKTSCGSYAGYRAHLNHDETPCGPCVAGNRDWVRDYRQRRKESRVADVA